MRKILIVTLTAALGAAGVAQAATTTTTTFAVTATVLSTCSASAAALAFPNYTPGGGVQTGSTTISVKCTKNTSFTVGLNAGSTPGDAFVQRLMASGANTLQYNLYIDNGYSKVFGDGTPGSQTVTALGLGVATAAAVPVFGQLPDSAANQAAVPGSYSDLITVTVSY
jgi:spore coat protein U-like protein